MSGGLATQDAEEDYNLDGYYSCLKERIQMKGLEEGRYNCCKKREGKELEKEASNTYPHITSVARKWIKRRYGKDGKAVVEECRGSGWERSKVRMLMKNKVKEKMKESRRSEQKKMKLSSSKTDSSLKKEHGKIEEEDDEDPLEKPKRRDKLKKKKTLKRGRVKSEGMDVIEKEDKERFEVKIKKIKREWKRDRIAVKERKD
ncbi:hypothetical protein Tco_0336609 [Tanacetum coccineum]